VVGRDVLVDCRQLGQGDRHVLRVRLHLVHRAEPVKGAEHPQVSEVIVAPGEVEQPEPIADRERVEVQRVASGVAPVLVLLVHLASTIPARAPACAIAAEARGGERTATKPASR
jgi:hypothetical protein